MTKLPKAAIQSEAMTVRTASSLLASIISLLLHLWGHPRTVVWICSALPIILSIAVAVVVPERLDGRFKAFAVRSREIRRSLGMYSGYGGGGNQTNETSSLTMAALGTKSSSIVIEDDFGPDIIIDERSNHQYNTTTTTATSQIEPNQNHSIKQPLTTSSSTTCCGRIWVRVATTLSAMKLVWKPLLFMLLLRSMPTATDPMMSYIFGHLTLPPWLLSAYSFISISGGLLASIFYWKFCTTIPLIPALIIFTLLAATLGTFPNFVMTNQWINHHMHVDKIPNWSMVFISTFITSIFSRFAMMPTIILAAETAPQHFGLEATMFSIYTATNNVGNIIATVGNVYLIKKLGITSENFTQLSTLIIICAISSVIPLLFTPLIWCTQKDIKRIERQRREALEQQDGTI